ERSRGQHAHPIVIHAASMGEFEHIKPLVIKLSEFEKYPVIVTFFSPSAYEHVKRFSGVDLIVYLPFDFAFTWKRFYKHLSPKALIISKHDAWPNQVWEAKKHNLPVYLVNASLNDQSSRIRWPARFLFNSIYSSVTQICTISNEDRQTFEKYFNNIRVDYVGDTKFDQVLIRKERALRQEPLLPEYWQSASRVILLGSVWKEDGDHIFPAVSEVLENHEDIKCIIVPHQPEEAFVQQIKSQFNTCKPVRFTELNQGSAENRVMIVDKIGVLADLYQYAFLAYVGGSFRQGIHNVMEPAVYGIPVLFGPVHLNSFEAKQLVLRKGALVVSSTDDTFKILQRFITNRDAQKKVGKKAYEFAKENTGATEKIVQLIIHQHLNFEFNDPD
ncbi:MAG: hypothetical protein GF313_13090, partial [Caldithrix sp.]|nr:hypothetical protein [Caldithrix sp.]